MYSRARIAFKYLQYFLTSSSGSGHGTHSPFVFEFIQKVLNNSSRFPEYVQIEKLRMRLLKDNTLLPEADFGARAEQPSSVRFRTVAAIAAAAAKSPKYARLLFHIAKHYGPNRVLEMGTSLGISTACLAAAHPNTRVVTGEGNPAHASVARNNLDSLGLSNVKIFTGPFQDTLPEMLEALTTVDIAFIDGNHRLEPTLNYFNMIYPRLSDAAVVIIDDIHWSSGMESAWTAIRQDPQVMLTVDLFFLGIVFRDPGFKIKQHFVIRF